MEQIHRKLGVQNRVGVVLRLIQIRDTLGADVSVTKHQPNYVSAAPPQQSIQTGNLND